MKNYFLALAMFTLLPELAVAYGPTPEIQQKACRAVTYPLIGSRSACIELSAERSLGASQILSCGQLGSSREFILCLKLVNDPDRVPACFRHVFSPYDTTSGSDAYAVRLLLPCLDRDRYEAEKAQAEAEYPNFDPDVSFWEFLNSNW